MEVKLLLALCATLLTLAWQLLSEDFEHVSDMLKQRGEINSHAADEFKWEEIPFSIEFADPAPKLSEVQR